MDQTNEFKLKGDLLENAKKLKQTNTNFWLKTKNKVILKGTLDFALPKNII